MDLLEGSISGQPLQWTKIEIQPQFSTIRSRDYSELEVLCQETATPFSKRRV